MGIMQAAEEERKEKERERRRERKARQAESKKPEWKGFVSCELGAAEKRALQEGAMSYDEAWEGLVEALPGGYKLSLSYDDRNDTYTASLTGGAGTGGNAGWCLTGRGSRLDGAVVSLAYKHFIMLKRDWESVGGTADRPVIDFA